MFNTFLVYEPPFYKSQHGIIGHIAGGWTFAPILSVGSGLPLEVSPTDANDNEVYGGGQAFGEGEGSDFAALQNAVLICPNNFGSSRHNNMPTTGGFGTRRFGQAPCPALLGFFLNPAGAVPGFREPGSRYGP